MAFPPRAKKQINKLRNAIKFYQLMWDNGVNRFKNPLVITGKNWSYS